VNITNWKSIRLFTHKLCTGINIYGSVMSTLDKVRHKEGSAPGSSSTSLLKSQPTLPHAGPVLLDL